MDFLMVVSIVLLLSWSAYSVMHSRKKARHKALLFYSELIPYMQEYELSQSTTQFPVLSGVYEGYKVRLVPEADNLVLQRLPRLYLRIYVYVPNTVLLRLRKQDIDTQSNHLFLPSSFEKSRRVIRLNNQEYRLFLSDGHYPLNLEAGLAKLFPASDNCAEMLFQRSFIRVTILLSRGKKSSYVMTRATDFLNLIFRREFFQTYFQAVLELRKELSRPEVKAPTNSNREVTVYAGDAWIKTS